MGSLQLLTSSSFLPKQIHTTTKPIFIPIHFSGSSYSKPNTRKTIRTGDLQSARAVVDRKELDENPEGILSGEWPENFSLLSYDDLRAYLEPSLFKDKAQPSVILRDVMSTVIRTATPDQSLEEIEHHFEFVSGLPVVDGQLRCIGVISKSDRERASNGAVACNEQLSSAYPAESSSNRELKSKVEEVMSSPAETLPPGKTVMDAAALMLKSKIHRIPVVNRGGQVIGMVTRTDIFKALEGVLA